MAVQSIAVVALLVAVCQVALAVDHQVGDAAGWRIQPGYDQWAARNTFRVGDRLFFTYTNNHNVLEINEADYNNCVATGPIQSYLTPSPIVVNLTRSGQHWFLCGIPGHCEGGMRVPINVLDQTSDGGAPIPRTNPAPGPSSETPPPPDSAATSIFSTGVAAAAVGAIAALL